MDKITEVARGYSGEALGWALTHGARIIVIVLAVFAGHLLLRYLLRRFIGRLLHGEAEGSEKEKRAQTLAGVLSMAGAIVLFTVGVLTVVSELGIDIKPVLASVGIGGLAIGFGAQSLVKDLIAGFFLLMENQIRVGDVVRAAGQGGMVEKVGLRALVLRDLGGNRIVIPNGEIGQVTNMTYQFSRYVFDIGVAYQEDVDRVMEVMKRVGESMQRDPEYGELITEPLEIFGLDSFGDSAVVIRARITTKPIKQWAVGREYNRRLKKAFDQEGIEMPFPHRTVYLGRDEAERLGRAFAGPERR